MTPQDRINTLAATRAAFPNLSDEDALHVAEWALTGNAPLNADRVDAAAQALAGALGKTWTEREVRNSLRGVAQTTITAYLSTTTDAEAK